MPLMQLRLKVKVADEWLEQVTGLGLEIEDRNYSMIDAQGPSPPTRFPAFLIAVQSFVSGRDGHFLIISLFSYYLTVIMFCLHFSLYLACVVLFWLCDLFITCLVLVSAVFSSLYYYLELNWLMSL